MTESDPTETCGAQDFGIAHIVAVPPVSLEFLSCFNGLNSHLLRLLPKNAGKYQVIKMAFICGSG
jgi:hypothetical protein